MISVIITSLNEKNDILNKTIKSIKETCNNQAEIIVIDDCSDHNIKLDYNDVFSIRNSERLGVAKSRDKGVKLAKNPYIFITDAHMIFKNGWYENVLKSLIDKPKSLYCGTCLGLSEEKFELKNCAGKYTGARLFFYETNEFLDGKWTSGNGINKDYEISCIMGACYFMHRSWYDYIKGLEDLTAWGSDEPCLSIKTWLAGGEVRINEEVVVGHMFRHAAPYCTEIRKILYNKIRMIESFFPSEIANKLYTKMETDPLFMDAIALIQSDKEEIFRYKEYYKSIFVKDIYWLVEKFNIILPE
jgi:polypeptide N-acetylgalactosaminyltransferase